MLTSLVKRLQEVATKHGMESVYGIRRENICTRDLSGYFHAFGELVDAGNIHQLVLVPHVEAALNAAEMRLQRICRTLQPVLLEILSVNLMAAMQEGYKETTITVPMVEAAVKKPVLTNAEIKRSLQATLKQLDKVGLSAQEAADYAAKHAAKLVSGLDKETVKQIREAMRQAILDQQGVEGLQRAIRAKVKDMSISRARAIASTEMNDAFSEAAMRKLKNAGVGYKRLSLSTGACQTCRNMAAQGAIPLDKPFRSGKTVKLRTPIHTRCRCATVGARAPI
jgi:hypothetical protein